VLDGMSAVSSWGGVPVRPFPARGGCVDAAPVRPGDPLALLYTSGTTGPAKGVCCPHAQFYWWGVNTARALDIGAEDTLYSCLPLFHTNALNTLVQALVSGCRFVIGPRFSASRFWRRIAEADATVTYLLGAMVSILDARPVEAVERGHRLRVALAPATRAAFHESFPERFGVRLVEAHGMTETNLAIGPRDDEQRAGAMGRVMPGFDARVVDPEDTELPDGTPGELLLRATEPFAFSTGYWDAPAQTLAAWRNLWFHTGDRVVRDADGYFWFLDRIKDVIRRRGENISAWEVEQVLQAHPDLAVAAVIPVPSELGEDEVMACVVPRPGCEPEPEALIAHCESRLAYYAIPRYVEILPALPLTENGKVKKFALRERGITPSTWDREEAGYVLDR
jgi:crotonobetaine/carnitine-CoA ligase